MTRSRIPDIGSYKEVLKLKVLITREKKMQLCMVTDINQTYCCEHSAVYTIKSLCQTPETNMSYVSYILIKKKKEEKRRIWVTGCHRYGQSSSQGEGRKCELYLADCQTDSQTPPCMPGGSKCWGCFRSTVLGAVHTVQHWHPQHICQEGGKVAETTVQL